MIELAVPDIDDVAMACQKAAFDSLDVAFLKQSQTDYSEEDMTNAITLAYLASVEAEERLTGTFSGIDHELVISSVLVAIIARSDIAEIRLDGEYSALVRTFRGYVSPFDPNKYDRRTKKIIDERNHVKRVFLRNAFTHALAENIRGSGRSFRAALLGNEERAINIKVAINARQWAVLNELLDAAEAINTKVNVDMAGRIVDIIMSPMEWEKSRKLFKLPMDSEKFRVKALALLMAEKT